MAEPEGAPDELIARAIERVLHQVPPSDDAPLPEGSTKLQPWAETASPSSKNKRPLETLLEEYAARVAAAPDARAEIPGDRHPGDTFFDRFSKRGGGGGGGEGGGRRRSGGRRRRRGGDGGGATQAPAAAAPTAPKAPAPGGQGDAAQRSRRRRRRSGRRRGGGGGAGGGGGGGSA